MNEFSGLWFLRKTSHEIKIKNEMIKTEIVSGGFINETIRIKSERTIDKTRSELNPLLINKL